MTKDKHFTVFFKGIAQLLAIAIGVLGAVVIVGWYLNLPQLIQISKDFVPMQYNTALGFLLSGLALLFLLWDKKRVAAILGFFVFMLGVLTLIQYVFGIDMGIDQLFMDHYITVKTSHPGRMAPNTALNFILSGMVVLVSCFVAGKKHRGIIVGFLGSLILFLGTFAFVGYFIDIQEAYAWGNLTKMAIHTAFGFMFVGSVVLIGLWYLSIGRAWIESSITRRLSVYILIPISILYLSLATYNIYLVKEATYREVILQLKEVGWQNTSAVEKRLYAAEEIARSTQRFLITQSDLQEKEIYDALTSNLTANKNMHGAGISFFSNNQEMEFSPYYYKQNDSIQFINLVNLDPSFEIYNKFTPSDTNTQASWSEPFKSIRTEREWLISYTIPLVKDNSIWAIVEVDMFLSNLQKVFDAESLDDFAYGVISAEANYIFTSYNSQIRGENMYKQGDTRSMTQENRTLLADEMLKGSSGYTSVDLIGGDSFHTQYNPIGTTGYTFFIGLNQSYIMKPVKEVSLEMMVIFILILFIFIFIIYFVSRQLSLRILRLNKATNQLSQGHLDTEIKMLSGDEIGVLSQNFSIMANQLSNREKELRKLNLELEGKVKERTLDLENEKYFIETFVDSLQALFYVFDAHGNFVRWNKKYLDVSGFNNDDMAKLSPYEIVEQGDKEKMKAALNKVYKDGYAETEALIVNSNGETIPYVFNGYKFEINGEVYVAGLGFDIAERKSLEMQVAAEKNQLQKYLDSSPIAAFISVDEDLKYKNKRFEELLGMQVNSCISNLAIAPKDKKKLETLMQEGKPITNFQFQLLSAQGKTIDVVLNALLVNYKGSKGYLNWLVDISEYIDLNRNFVALLNSTTDFIYFKDKKRKFSAVSQTMADITGFKTRVELEGLSDRDIFPSQHVEIYEAEEDLLLSGKETVIETTTPYKMKSGEEGWISTKKFALNDNYGNMIGIFGMSRDITQLKKIENELKEASEQAQSANVELAKRMKQLSDMVVGLPIATALFEPDGKMIILNQKFTELLGYDIGDLPDIGLHWELFYPDPVYREELFQRSQKDVEQMQKTGKPIDPYEARVMDKSGVEHVVEIHNQTVGELSLSMLVDLDERKRFEESLKKAKLLADEANTAKSTFLANMSHEIRTPMNAVLGFSELLDKLVQSDLEKSYVKSIIASGKSLMTLINDILDLSKIEAGKMDLNFSYFNIKGVLNEIESIFILKTKEKGLELIFEIGDDTPLYVHSDEIRLRQILINLISNAIKFTNRGYIKVFMQVEFLPRNKKGETWSNINIGVEDTGIGISEQFKNNLFQTFTQQDGEITKKFGGTGLGLSISKNLAALMNGDISFVSEEGKGSTFTFSLNCVQYTHEFELETSEKLDDLKTIQFDAASVLIVDDIENNRKYLYGALSNYNFKLLEAANGKEALQVLASTKVDLIITDLRMPEMDGFELIKKLKQDPVLKHLKVIATSASVMTFSIKKAKDYNFDDFLSKPVKQSDLINCLSKYLPYQLEGNGKKLPEVEEQNLSIDGLDKESLLEELTLLESMNENLLEHQSMEEVEEFATALFVAGEKFKIKPLLEYSQGLGSALESFDIEAMLLLINKFPEKSASLRAQIS